MKMERILAVLLMIAVLIFSACSRNKENQSSAEDTEELSESITEDNVIAEAAQTPAAAEGYNYSKILNGDFSEFAGTWVNSSCRRIKLNADGSFIDGFKSSPVIRSEDSYYGTGIYQWGISSESTADGFNVSWGIILFPVGVDVKEGGHVFQSDTAKVRVALVQQDFSASHQLYYREEISPVQNAQELRVSSFINGNLSPGQGIWYRVRSAELGLFTIEVDSGIDTYLEAYDKDLNFIKENDDWYSHNPRIEFLADANTAYYIRFNSYSGNERGSFRIMASHKPMIITDLRSGSHNGFLESGKEYWYRFRTSGIGTLNIHTTGNTDTVLELFDENLDFIASDDDSGEYNNAKIKIDVVPSQIFFIKLRAASDNMGGASDPYVINARVDPYPVPVTLNPGAFINARIERGEDHWYSVRITRKDFDYLIIETSGISNLIFDVFNALYIPVNFYDYSSHINIDIFNVEAGAVFYIRIRSDYSGSYRVLAREAYSL